MSEHERRELWILIGNVRTTLRVAIDLGHLDDAETLSRILRNLLDCTR